MTVGITNVRYGRLTLQVPDQNDQFYYILLDIIITERETAYFVYLNNFQNIQIECEKFLWTAYFQRFKYSLVECTNKVQKIS